MEAGAVLPATPASFPFATPPSLVRLHQPRGVNPGRLSVLVAEVPVIGDIRKTREWKGRHERHDGIGDRMKGRTTLPAYDYLCRYCNRDFTVFLSLVEFESKPRIKCRYCGSYDVERKMSAFFAVTGKKS